MGVDLILMSTGSHEINIGRKHAYFDPKCENGHEIGSKSYLDAVKAIFKYIAYALNSGDDLREIEDKLLSFAGHDKTVEELFEDLDEFEETAVKIGRTDLLNQLIENGMDVEEG